MGKKRYLGVAFVVLFGGSMIVHLAVNNTVMQFDSSVYWESGKECGWSVKNLTSGFRGYFLPYIFSMCYKFGAMAGSDFLGYRIFASLVFAFTFTVSFAGIAKLLQFELSDQHTILGGAGCGIIFFYFFRGLFIYTLSDFYAFSLSLFSILLLNAIVRREQKAFIKGLEGFVLGLCLYGTYNIRTIYLFLMIACLGVLVVWQLYEKKWINLMITFPACLVGMAVCAVPQMLLNYNLNGNYSWQVPTEGLMLQQVQWGIRWQRYATYIGDSSEYGSAGMHFIDRIGQTILETAQMADLEDGAISVKQFIKLVLHYPLDFLGIYTRHLLNMLYPIYPEQYIEDITRDKSLNLVFFYSIFFMAASNFVHSFKLKSNKWVWFLLILLPCACILPGAVEIRFFIAYHFLVYMYAVLGMKEFWGRLKKGKVKYMLSYLTGFLLYVAYAGMMLSATAEGIAIINS